MARSDRRKQPATTSGDVGDRHPRGARNVALIHVGMTVEGDVHSVPSEQILQPSVACRNVSEPRFGLSA